MRIDDNRPSGAEQAAIDDRKRQNVKSKDKAMESAFASQLGKAQQTKDTTSSFDQLLEQRQSPDHQTQGEMLKFDAKLKDVLSDDQQGRDSKSDSKQDKEDDKKTRSSSEDRERGTSTRETSTKGRILGKQDMGRQGGGSGGGSGSSAGGDQGGSSQQFGQQQLRQGKVVQTEVAPAFAPGMARPESTFTKKMEGVDVPREIPKQVLDQIVQHVRVGLNKNLDKEMQIDFSEKFM